LRVVDKSRAILVKPGNFEYKKSDIIAFGSYSSLIILDHYHEVSLFCACRSGTTVRRSPNLIFAADKQQYMDFGQQFLEHHPRAYIWYQALLSRQRCYRQCCRTLCWSRYEQYLLSPKIMTLIHCRWRKQSGMGVSKHRK
jgi:hypothetical protein